MSPRGHFGGYQVIFCGFVNSAIKRTFSVAFVLEHSVHRGCSENHRTGRGVNSRSSLVEISSRPFGYRIIELLFAREYPQRLNKTRKFGSPTGDDAPTSETCVESPLSPHPAFAVRRNATTDTGQIRLIDAALGATVKLERLNKLHGAEYATRRGTFHGIAWNRWTLTEPLAMPSRKARMADTSHKEGVD